MSHTTSLLSYPLSTPPRPPALHPADHRFFTPIPVPRLNPNSLIYRIVTPTRIPYLADSPANSFGYSILAPSAAKGCTHPTANPFIYRIYADLPAKSFIYRIYANTPGVGVR